MERRRSLIVMISLLVLSQFSTRQVYAARGASEGLGAIAPRPAASSKRESPDFKPYLADVQTRVKRAWFPPKGYESKRVTVIFDIHRGGELSNLKLVQGSGVQIADQAALKAVENAAPFRPLPANSSKQEISIQFVFDNSQVPSGSRAMIVGFKSTN